MASMQRLLVRLLAVAAAFGRAACRVKCSHVQEGDEWPRLAGLYNAASGPLDILDFASGHLSQDFMARLTPRGAHNVFDSFMAQGGGAGSRLTAALLGQFLTEAVAPVAAPGPCSLFVEFLEYVPFVDCLPAMCREEYVAKCNVVREETAAGLTRGWMQSHGQAILTCWGRRPRSMRLFRLQGEALRFVFEEHHSKDALDGTGSGDAARRVTLCSLITLDMLVGLSKDQLAMVPPACAKRIQRLDKQDHLLTALLGRLPVTFFNDYEGTLADSTVKLLPPEIVRELGSCRQKRSKAARPLCHSMDMRLLSPLAAEGLSVACILANAKSKSTGLGPSWRHVTVVKEICKLPEADWRVLLLGGIPLEDFYFFPQELVRCMLEDEDRAALLMDVPGEIFLDESITEVRVAPSTLAMLSGSHPELCGQILSKYAKIPDKALANIEGSDVLALSAHVSGRHRVGFELLAVLASHREGANFMYSITSGARVHICALIADEEELLSLHWLWPHLTPQCIRRLPFSITDSLIITIPRLLHGRGIALSFVKGLSKALLKDNSTPSYSLVGQTMREPIMCSTVGGSDGAFCQLLGHFDDDTIGTIDRHCALQLRACLTDAIIPRLPSDAFYYFSSETKPMPALHLLRPAQIPLVSLGLSPSEAAIKAGLHRDAPLHGSGESLFVGLTSRDLAIWTDSQIGAITAMQWSVTDSSATAVIGPALISLLSHKRLCLLSTGHIENLPFAAICRMSPAQVAHVGLLSDAKVERLEEASHDMTPDSCKALKVRAASSRDRAARKAKEEAFFRTVILPVVILLAVTALLASGAILYMRQAIRRAKAP